MESKVEQLGKVCFTVDKEYHNINRDYDKLVIVESYENKATYASRKPVPKGTSLNDREYWIKFSSLAEHIEQNYNVIQQELNELYNKVGVGINFYGDYSTFDFNSSKTITLNFNTVNSFEKASVVKLYQNDTLMDTYTNISEFTKEVTVSSEVTFKVIAKIGNYTFAATWEVTTAYNWYIGGGATYQSMMIDSNKHSGTEEPISSVQTITVNHTGDYIFICVQKNMILPEITMGGFPIPFDDPYNAIVDGVEYNIYKSSNSYKVGTYVIKLGAVTWDNDDVLKNLLASITGFSATEQELDERLTVVEHIVGDYNPGGSHRTPEVIPTVDEEDLTIGSDNVFKFKNRPNTGGMGMIILRKDKTFAEQLTQTNTIYVVQYNFDLAEESVTIPENSVLKFDGGTIDNGTIIGNNTRLIYDKPIDEVCPAERQGTFIYNTTVVDEEDITSESGHLKFKDRPATDGMGRKILRKNIVDGVNTLTQEMMSDANTIYVIQYDFTLGEDITIPENCVLEFEGGSLSNGTLVGNETKINAHIVKIFDNIILDGSFLGEGYVEWFGAKTNDTYYSEINRNAINQCIKGFQTILFGNSYENKLYYISPDLNNKCIVINKENKHIIGRGISSTVLSLINNNEDTSLIELSGETSINRGRDCIIENISLYGTNKNSSIAINIGYYCRTINLRNISISTFNIGVNSLSWNQNYTTIKVDNCHIGFNIGDGRPITTYNIQSCFCGDCDYGYILTSVEYSKMIACGCDRTLQYAYTLDGCHAMSIDSCGGEANKFGFRIINSGYQRNKHINVTNFRLILLKTTAEEYNYTLEDFRKYILLDGQTSDIIFENWDLTIHIPDNLIDTPLSQLSIMTVNPADNTAPCLFIKNCFFEAPSELSTPYYNLICVDLSGGKYYSVGGPKLELDYKYESTARRPNFINSVFKGTEYFDKELNQKIIWNGEEWRNLDGFHPCIKKGTTEEMPKGKGDGGVLDRTDYGFAYFNTDFNKTFYLIQLNNSLKNAVYVDSDGFSPAKHKGGTDERPTTYLGTGLGGELRKGNDEGFQYFDTDLNKPIWVKEISNTSPYTVTWVDATGTSV